ncbi:non-SMC mitotic condensation complex subunit 1-domain-containing protein [Mycena belliarum]|uniref:Condensin complex subunit 1 n=1 Tax=Mycena belliarum TaxID=1033014 RepID=A0AAD6U3V8_9AGAR|nr:non-SMC mitotic condensation complex subunit 1-domain-containing protein [Mycena belliae]
MADSFELRDELQALQDLDTYNIPHEHDLATEDPARLLEGAVEAVAEQSDAIGDSEVFDVYRSLLKYSDAVPGATMSKLLDSLASGLQAELEATTRDLEQEAPPVYLAHKVTLEMYAFLLQWFVSAAEKVKQADGDGPATPAPKARKPRGGKAAAAGRSARSANAKKSEWTWFDQIPGTLNLISKVLRLSTSRIWTTTAEKDTFISCLTRPAYHVTETEAYMKSQDIKLSVYKVICLAVKHHGHSFAAQITIIQSLQFFEHLSEPMAECLTILAKEFDHAQLGDEVLREVASMNFTGQDNKGPRTFSKFLIKFSELAPRLMLKQMSLLLGQLDSEAYPMRIGVVEVIGHIIQDLAEAEEDESSDGSQKKQINGLYDLLLERALDVSSYVRTKVLGVLSRLCDMKSKFPKQRLAVTQAAVGALEDKVATVRKSAAALIVKLLLTHPYGLMYGGMLTLETWENDYRLLKAELAKKEALVGDGSTQQVGEDDGGDGDAPAKKSKKTKKSSDSMDVDGEEGDGGDTEPEDEEEEEEEDDDDEDPSAMSVDAEGEELQTPKKKKKKVSKLQPRKSQIAVDMTNEQVALETLETNQVLHLRLRKKYYVEALNFIRQIEGTMDTMEKLLGSKNKPEVLEAMEFFRVAHEYQFTKAEFGIKKMLHLIWSKDNSNSTSEDGQELKGIRQRLLECYRGLYFDVLPDMEPKAQVNRIAKNMIELTYNATLAELTSLEEMMRIMMDDDQIHGDVIAKLWSVYSISKPLPKAQRQGAIIILGMLALAKRGVLTDHVDVMLKVGLGHLGKADLTLARYTCVALQRLNGSAKKIKGSLLDKTIRIEMENPIFQKLQEAVEHPSRSKEWFGLAEQAINTAYALGDHPDVLCNDLIKKLTFRAFAPRAKASANADPDSMVESSEPMTPAEKDPDAMDEDHPGDISRGSEDSTAPPQVKKEKSSDVGDAFELSQLLFVVGHVAIKHIVYLELVEREWKRQKDETDGAEKQANSRAKDREELDQVAGNAEDEIGERIAGVRETELLYGPQSLLAVYGPMLAYICGSPQKFKNRTLRAAATLSFSKFLCVSSQFCDQNHLLLFKILETSKNANIRSNIVIALGDVAVSFSSIIDENSNELYKGLSDPDLVVKKNTLMVLTHLILNGMIKVKGQLGEMAKCIEDPETRVSDLAKLFFKELSTKDNAIYNNLPDVISHLGIGAHAVDEETFQRTLTYIFSFIEKEKQAESIVEKLCQRFHLSEEPRQWRDIAFCLSLLPFKSERSVKKLIEGLPFYRDKLHEETVFERFTEILNKARQNKSPNKPDTELAEFEQILEENRMQGEEDRDLEKRVQGKKAAAKKRASKRKGRKKTVVAEDEEDEE